MATLRRGRGRQTTLDRSQRTIVQALSNEPKRYCIDQRLLVGGVFMDIFGGLANSKHFTYMYITCHAVMHTRARSEAARTTRIS